jgi:CheY-like chemotaxis protein
VSVFISHSFDDQAEFQNVTDWLESRGVPYWKPDEIKPGASLRGQLRQAVGSCSVCIFIATRNSVSSSWCGAELGAFWGADIPVITYLADSSLPDEALPPILQGDVYERVLSKVAARAAELVRERDGSGPKKAISPGDRVTNMTVEQLESLIAGAVSLVRAGEEQGAPADGQTRDLGEEALDAAGRVLRAADAASQIGREPDDAWRRRILWVDDRPDNNVHERQVFESLGLTFDLALTTDEGLERLRNSRYGAIISDMGRREGPREGYRLLDAVRAYDTVTPFFIYAGSNAPEHKREAASHGAQGSTNRADDLVDMVTQALSSGDATYVQGRMRPELQLCRKNEACYAGANRSRD